MVIEESSIQEIWVNQAELLIEFEFFGVAKEILLEALFHAKAFDDKNTIPKCYHLLAILSRWEGDGENAVRVN